MTPLKLEMTVDQINLVLEALGQQAYVRVHRLIAQIRAQAEAQLTAPHPGTEILQNIAAMGSMQPTAESAERAPVQEVG